jgi:hypothetical protein
MITESFFSLMCASMIAFLFGLTLTFAGYRFFLFLLPVWGFFFGLALGAQTLQALFGTGFLATISSWVAGFIVGAIFAVLSYLFYFFAVVMIAGSLGYSLAVGLMLWLGMSMNFLVWIIAIVAAIALAIVTIVFNLQKYVVIAATSILGAGAVIATFVFLFNPAATLMKNPVQVALQTSPLLAILFLVLAVCGFVVQFRDTRSFELETYNRMAV